MILRQIQCQWALCHSSEALTVVATQFQWAPTNTPEPLIIAVTRFRSPQSARWPDVVSPSWSGNPGTLGGPAG